MPRLERLVAFVESAATGSFSAAARKLDLTPAAVSKSVLKLEDELGLRLFNRSTRQLRLTHEGERFLARMLPGHFRGVSDLMRDLRPGERKALVRLLGKVQARAETLRRKAGPAG